MGSRKSRNADAPVPLLAPERIAVPAAAKSLHTVVFLRPHQHAGRDYIKDDTLVCDEAARELLLRFGVIGGG